MWKQNRSYKSDWCTPRKVVNMYSEYESSQSVETLVKSAKRRKTKSSLRANRNRRIKRAVKGMRGGRRYVRSDIIPRCLQQGQEPTVFEKVKKRALLATASKRVKQLALPKNVALLNTDIKKSRDPFKVRPSALKAVCSPRTKMLAKPKNLENFVDELHNTIAKQS